MLDAINEEETVKWHENGPQLTQDLLSSKACHVSLWRSGWNSNCHSNTLGNENQFVDRQQLEFDKIGPWSLNDALPSIPDDL